MVFTKRTRSVLLYNSVAEISQAFTEKVDLVCVFIRVLLELHWHLEQTRSDPMLS